jgi:RNA polymerase sigma-70 factor, ECF subfamily
MTDSGDNLGHEPTIPRASMSTPEAPMAFAAVFRGELGYVCGVLRRLGVQERDIEDVAQEVFVQVHRRLDSYDPARPLRPWLFGFAYRCASSYRRSPLQRHAPDENVGMDAVAPAPEEKSEADLVSAALAQLDVERRAILIAFEVEDIPMKEIADALGIPVNTAYSRVRLAREAFASAIERCRQQRRA